jgi:membrane fusion protein, macrolide-specific efflux system
MKKLRLLITIVVILVFGLASAFYFSRRDSDSETLPVTRGDMVESVYGLGTVTANESFQLKIGVTRSIKTLFVREGDTVKTGDALVKFDEGSLFRAPFAGTITALPFKEHETVFPQVPLLTLVNLRDRYILISLEQDGALQVRAGQTAKINFEILRGRIFEGKVRSLYPGDHQFYVQIDVPELPPEVLPGMTGDVAIEVARRKDVILVPIRGVQSGRVTIRGKNKNQKVAVTIGAVDGRSGELLSGDLKPGDEVVLPRK